MTDEDITSAERKLIHNTNMILTKKKKLAMLVMERKMMKETKQNNSGMGQFVRRVISNVTDGLGFANESRFS